MHGLAGAASLAALTRASAPPVGPLPASLAPAGPASVGRASGVSQVEPPPLPLPVPVDEASGRMPLVPPSRPPLQAAPVQASWATPAEQAESSARSNRGR